MAEGLHVARDASRPVSVPSPLMRILFDARSVRTSSGRYVLQGLTTGWKCDARVSGVIAAVRPDFDLALLPDGVEAVRLAGGSWAKHLASELQRVADRSKAEIIFCPNGLAPRDARGVWYFQDMFHFRLDGGVPKPGLEWLKNRARTAWRRWSGKECRVAVSVSQQVADALERQLTLPSVVIPNGVDVGDSWWQGDGSFAFVLGGIGPRKDEQSAVRAWACVPSEVRSATRLYIAGVEPTIRRERLRALSENLGLERKVVITGTVPRNDYLNHIARARVVISCSRLEAFGLPVAESLAMGAPVICTAIPSHLELLEATGVGRSFAVRDFEQLALLIGDALKGQLPRTLKAPPVGWAWCDRAREHVDAYLRYA